VTYVKKRKERTSLSMDSQRLSKMFPKFHDKDLNFNSSL